MSFSVCSLQVNHEGTCWLQAGVSSWAQKGFKLVMQFYSSGMEGGGFVYKIDLELSVQARFSKCAKLNVFLYFIKLVKKNQVSSTM